MGFNRRNPKPETRNRQRKLVSSDETETRNRQRKLVSIDETRNPKPETDSESWFQATKPETRNRQRKLVSIDETRNPKPETRNRLESDFWVALRIGTLTLKQPGRDLERHEALQRKCLSSWKSICFQLWQQSIIAVNEDKPMHILFHCFGGINRSAAILCAWPIVAYDYSAEDAIKLLLTRGPSLRRWRHRDYVLDALWMVEQQRSEWCRDFQHGAASLSFACALGALVARFFQFQKNASA